MIINAYAINIVLMESRLDSYISINLFFAVLNETTVIWTEKGFDGSVAIRGIQGMPADWIKNGIQNTFSSAPLRGSALYWSHRLALAFR